MESVGKVRAISSRHWGKCVATWGGEGGTQSWRQHSISIPAADVLGKGWANWAIPPIWMVMDLWAGLI